ncbi:hypothetical protein PN499_22320 [Kamptonema animale CS-326]|uniref:hypothetical protein n=1 Tax=Kamptonema animale TaxID=92934 RepID=UPI00232C3B02|nr:hypothetical protein [Kamptonema animale]MDB9513940.1 hypothetical protein [Kamptonema animale CS-326]
MLFTIAALLKPDYPQTDFKLKSLFLFPSPVFLRPVMQCAIAPTQAATQNITFLLQSWQV